MDSEISVRGFYPDFEEKITHLVVGNADFFNKFKGVLNEELFSIPNHRYLIGVIKQYSEKYKKHPKLETVREIIRKSDYRDRGGVLGIIDSVNGYDDTDFVGDQLINRARWTAIDQAVSLGTTPEDVAERVRLAVSIAPPGEQYITLDGYDPITSLQGNPIPTPWEWLNDQLSGGPEKMDLAIILSVINGGKTTALVNIAYRALAESKNVLYLTFEDGHRKITRRLKQRITGMSFEDMLENRQRSADKCKIFLERCGSKCIIKTMASRRDTVADAAAVIRNVPDKPDVVITDYADRFRPRIAYKEPRHSLREIFEDCKQLAKDFDVLHWSARQVNKSRVGKGVVGIEHAGEGWGTMESPDLVIGIGRSMEDERLGRITLYTAKVRDHESHKTRMMMADFDRQKIWDPTE